MENFVVLSRNEQEDINGGLIGIIITGVVCIVGTVVADEALERNTEHDIAGWVGEGIECIGDAFKAAADFLKK